MRAEIVNPFIKAGIKVIEALVQQSVIRGTPTKSNHLFPHFNMASVIKIFGGVNGYVIYSMDNFTAHQLTSDLLYGMPVPSHSLMVKSAINEICNMVCGQAISIFEEEYQQRDISISVPIFLSDADQKVYRQNLASLNVPLLTCYGIIALSLGFEN